MLCADFIERDAYGRLCVPQILKGYRRRHLEWPFKEHPPTWTAIWLNTSPARNNSVRAPHDVFRERIRGCTAPQGYLPGWQMIMEYHITGLNLLNQNIGGMVGLTAIRSLRSFQVNPD